MGAAEQTKEVVELAVGYTKQIVEALTPIAKQAYDVGLMTLRVDAIESLVYCFALLAFGAGAFWCLRALYRKAKAEEAAAENIKRTYPRDAIELLPTGGVFEGLSAMIAAGAIGLAIVKLINVWLWVKLFSPELWLAHQAVEKLLK